MEDGMELNTKYLIIGNSAGGIGAAEAIRETDDTGSVLIVSCEPYPAYSRPLISKYLAGERTLDGMLFRPNDFYSRNNISLLLERTVKNLDLTRRIAYLESGEQITWDKLLLATGGVSILPAMDGIDKEGVFHFIGLDDAKAIDSFIGDNRKAVVIGGGLIGVSVTEALTERGLDVTIVEMKERILNTVLDEQASLMFEDALSRAGVEILTNHTVAEVTGKVFVDGVILDDGEHIPCDLVVVAIGVTPCTALALNSGINVNRGIVVDRYMATSYPDVYSCGDAAEVHDFIYETNRVIPIWPNAYIGGRVAGYNMAGASIEYAGITAMNSLNYFGLDITSAGVVAPQDSSKYEVFDRKRNGSYWKVVLSDDHVIGMVFVKDIEKSGIIFSLMRDRVNVGNFKQALLDDDFGLVYFPRHLRQERLGAICPDMNLVSTAPVEGNESLTGE